MFCKLCSSFILNDEGKQVDLGTPHFYISVHGNFTAELYVEISNVASLKRHHPLILYLINEVKYKLYFREIKYS